MSAGIRSRALQGAADRGRGDYWQNIRKTAAGTKGYGGGFHVMCKKIQEKSWKLAEIFIDKWTGM